MQYLEALFQNFNDNNYLWYASITIAFLVIWHILWHILKLTALIVFSIKKIQDCKSDAILFCKPLSLFFAFITLYFGKVNIPSNANVEAFFWHFNYLVLILGVTWLAITMSYYLFLRLRQNLAKNNKNTAMAVLPLANKLTKLIIIFFGVLFALKSLGFNINAIIATLGVGGIAIALASQKTIENLFGGIVLAVDQPIRVGDVGKFGSFIGTITDIGLRSTSIKTASRTTVTIPNASLSSDVIETYASRDKLLLMQNVIISYQTSSTELQVAIKEIEEIMLKNKKVVKEEARVKIVKFEVSGINMEVFAYINTTNLTEFLEVQQDIMLKIIDIINKKTKGFSQGNALCKYPHSGKLK